MSCCDHEISVGCCNQHNEAHGNDAIQVNKSSSCSKHLNHETMKQKENANTNLNCFALLREDGRTVDVFDVEGVSRTFSAGDTISPKHVGKKLCFSSHNHGDVVDSLLTHCFDEKGLHGEPEEGCFCGIDEPHLHAHIHDPVRCSQNVDNEIHSCSKKKNETDIMFLSQLTLMPVNGEENNDLSRPNFHIPVNENMPNECNSHLIKDKLSDCCISNIKSKGKLSVMVQHDDHIDYLVHNTHTGKLHLEHPCEDCGDTDMHGQFEPMGKRSWSNENDLSSTATSNPNIILHFYEVPTKPFKLIDQVSNYFCLGSCRVNAVRSRCRVENPQPDEGRWSILEAMMESPKPTYSPINRQGASRDSFSNMVRSEFPIADVNEILDFGVLNESIYPLKGVTDVHVVAASEKRDYISRDNLSAKLRVDHNPNICSAERVADYLQHELKLDVTFIAKFEKVNDTSPAKSIQLRPSSGRSTFLVSGICCASEIPAINKIVKPIPGVTKVMINVPNKTVYVDHEFDTVSASDIERQLNASQFGARIKRDAGASFVKQGNRYMTEDTLSKGSSPVTSDILTSTTEFLLKTSDGQPIKLNASSLFVIEGVTSIQFQSCTESNSLPYLWVDHDTTLISPEYIETVINSLKKRSHEATQNRKSTSNSPPPPITGRSSFYVEKICCASEIPAIKSIVEPLRGVESVNINVTTKVVYVDHDLEMIGGDDIANALNKADFGARIKKDARKIKREMNASSRAINDSEIVTRSSKFVETTLLVESFDPALDVLTIRNVFSSSFNKNQINNFDINLTWGTIKIDHNPNLLKVKTITGILEKEGLKINVLSDGEADGHWTIPLKENDENELIEQQIAVVNPFVLLSGFFWIISMFSIIEEVDYLKYVALLSVLAGLPHIAKKALSTLRRCQFDANCMMLFAALGAVALQEYTEAAAVTFLFSISEWLESRATSRARNALSELVNLRPERANLINPNTRATVMVPAESLAVGVLVSVRTGDKIPCDGIVVEGSSIVDESSLTGESLPVRKNINSEVSGGTINVGLTQLVVKTTTTVENSAVARLIRLVEEAQANRSPTETMIDRFAKRYTPIVVLASFCMCTIPWFFGKETGVSWTKNGLMTIVVACPCALIISTPVSYVAGLAAVAKNGTIVKGGAHLEALGQVKKVAFDKTGTLTEGCFAVLHLKQVSDRITRPQLLGYILAAESPSPHPIASALVTAARQEGISQSNMVTSDHTVLEGEGVVVNANSSKVHVGNKRLFDRLGLLQQVPPEVASEVEDWATNIGTVGYVSVEGIGIVGTYCVADAVRPESAAVVTELKALGIEVTMLTGDARKSALMVGNQIGLSPENIKSELLPSEKLSIVTGMLGDKEGFNPCNRRRLVLMCGDGVNDAPALACADVGVAMGTGAAISMETSDVTLMDSHLTKLVYCLKMGRRVKRTICQNILFSVFSKMAVMVLIILNKSTLWFAIISDVGAMLIVTLNGMKLLPRQTKKRVQKVTNFEDTERALYQTKERECEHEQNHEHELELQHNRHRHHQQEHCHSGCCNNKVDSNAKTATVTVQTNPRNINKHNHQHEHQRHEDHFHSGCRDKVDSNAKVLGVTVRANAGNVNKHHHQQEHSHLGCCNHKFDSNSNAADVAVQANAKTFTTHEHGATMRGHNVEEEVFHYHANKGSDPCRSGCCI